MPPSTLGDTPASPLRIAVIGHHVAPIAPPFAGGVESFTWYLTRWLARRGHEVTLFAPPGSAVPGVDVHALDLAPRITASARADVSMPPDAFLGAHHAYQRLMLALAADGAYDVVHSHSLHYLPVALAPLVGAPMLLTLHTPPTPWLESALSVADAAESLEISAVSRSTERSWAPVLDVDEIVPNGVDLSAWPAGRGGPAAAWAGRMVREKAPHLAIDAAKAAGLPLRLAGPVADPEYFVAQVAPRLGDGAEYLGHLGHEELAEVVGGSCVALMTPDWEEPFGLAAAEAIATGTPVAAFARGGLLDAIGPDAGRLAPPGDVDGLARAMREAARLPRRGVRAHAERSLGIDAMGRRYEAWYRRVLAARSERLVAA
ncbi:MAG TPA: glycosyltransferase family 4 protein [Solirubrobacteraceae bacterium]